MIATSMSLPFGTPFPFQLDNDCFINFVGTGVQTQFIAQFMNEFRTESAYTFSIRFLYSNYSMEEDIEENVQNLTLQESYFRYNIKLRGSCLVFMLYTPTFNETVTAIHDSGFGTSDEVLFFLRLQTLAEWEDHIEKFSALHEHSSFIFHANVVFIGLNSSYVGVHCYFCPPNPNRLHHIQFNSFSSYFQLKRFAQQLNSNGHGRHVVIESAIGDFAYVTNCLRIDRQFTSHNRHKFYQHLRKHCIPPDTIIYIPTQQAVNVTIVLKEKDVPEHELEDLQWFTRARFGESLLQPIPNEIMNTRGSILIMDVVNVQLVSCVTIHSLSRRLDYIFLSALDYTTWLALLSVALVYTMIYRNLSRGLDTMWSLFSLAGLLKHPKRLICFHWICMVFVSCIYGSNISSETLRLPAFPRIATLVMKGYRFWAVEKQHLFKLAGKYEKEVIVDLVSRIMDKATLNTEDYQIEFKKMQDYLYDGNRSKSIVQSMSVRNISKLIDNLTKLKLFSGSPTLIRNFGRAASGLMRVGDTQLCKVFKFNKISYRTTLRLWSYLSYRTSNLLQRFLEVGIPTKFKKLHIDLKHDGIRKLKITATGSFLPPTAITLMSAVGVSLLVLFLIGNLLLIINLLLVRINCYEMFLEFYKKLVRKGLRFTI
ncbi:unnamed protein product [Orchesella dallaii]|uniref:Uncharacterized protein n=1 Tax=Orchesella dallaii TaxID=48710 RepID=A0ABP1S4E4_9HEXA